MHVFLNRNGANWHFEGAKRRDCRPLRLKRKRKSENTKSQARYAGKESIGGGNKGGASGENVVNKEHMALRKSLGMPYRKGARLMLEALRTTAAYL